MPKTEPFLKKVAIAELFSSLQGEGPRMGERHLFIRFPVCNLHCQFCDERDHGVEEMLLGDLLAEAQRLEDHEGPHSFVSLTGGEPLLYCDVIRTIGPVLRRRGFKLYLETAGVHVEALAQVIDLIDMVSMDIKLPSVTKDRDYFSEHRGFLEVARQKEIYVKMVISQDLKFEELVRAVDMISEVDSKILLVLQPVTIGDERGIDPSLLKILHGLQRFALGRLEHVKILPRLHKVLGIP